MTDKGEIYTWGRGLYGVLGNGSNHYELTPIQNEEIKLIMAEDKNKKIEKLESVDEYTGALMTDGTFYVWGKNDRGQLGVGSGIGIDMVESENHPVAISVLDDK
jgi:alpha-tubulin suppressor-like RCC1 family protein